MTVTPTNVLRPLRAGEILDRAIRLYRRQFLQYIGVVALIQVPLVAVQLLAALLTFGDTFGRLEDMLANPAAVPETPFEVLGPGYFAGISLNGLVTILGFILVQGVAAAALTRAVAHHYMGQTESGSILGAYRNIKDIWFAMVGALLLVAAIGIGLLIWWAVPCVGWFTGGGMLVFLWLVILPLLAPVITLEKESPTRAWRRAWNLARRRFWWVLGFAGLLYLFNLLVVAGPTGLIGAAGQLLVSDPFDLNQRTYTIQTIIQAIATLVTSLLYLPLQVASMTVLYFDLRVRTEGLDLALESGQTEEGQWLPQPAGDAQGSSLLTGRDWRNFILVTFAAIGAFIVLYGLLIALVFAITTALSSGI
jgi:hypothetical protein